MLSKRLLGDSAIIAIGSFGRSIFQALILVVVARHLSLDAYGSLVAAVSLVSIFLPLSALGYEYEVLRSSSTDANIQEVWGQFLTISIITSFILFAIIFSLASIWLSSASDAITILLLTLSEIFAVRLLEGANRVHQGRGRMAMITITRLLFSGGRLVAVVWVIAATGTLTVGSYIFASTLASFIILIVVGVQLALQESIFPDLSWPPMSAWTRQFTTALSFSFDKITANTDKIMLASMSSAASAANFSVAHRLMDLISIPSLALVSALQSNQFRLQQNNFKIGRTLALPIIYVALVSPIVILFGDDVLNMALGDDYSAAAPLLNFLLFFPLTIFIKYMLTTNAIAKGDRHVVFLSTLSGAAVNLTINFAAIPIWGATAAVLSAFSAEITVIVILAIGLRHNRLLN